MELSKYKKLGLCAYWLFALLYWETLAHAGMFDQFQASFRFALGFAAALALAIAVLVSLLPRKALFPVSLGLSAVMILVYGSQMVYCFIFGTPYSVSQMGMGGDAVTSFWRETLGAMGEHILWLAALLLPVVILILLKKLDALCRPGWACRLIMAAAAVILTADTYVMICAGGTAMYSNHYFFTSPKSTTAQTMERFGVPMTFYLELTHTEDASGEEEPVLVVVTEPETLSAPVVQKTEGTEQETAEETQPPRYNVLPVDFQALNASTDNKNLIALNDYFAQLPGTKQNEYTGKFSDYNLILICAESFSPAAVDPVVTPTLYKLAHEGFLFRNFYNSFPNTTIDGEYSLTQGLYPDGARGKDDSSMKASATHLLPFTMANMLAEQRGVKSWGYHNNIASYYGRNLSHPNMGYDMKFNGKGMTMTGYWPTSDLEMMEQTVDDFIHEPQFHAYYMTFSGHYQYNRANNAIATANYPAVKDLPGYDEAQKCYLACHIELDKAMEYLLRRLEEEGIADKTVIVMAGDHFPYGLLKPQYFGMIGQPEDYFTMYKSDLVFWVGGMEEPVEVNEYCCNVDVLPTLLNLWGLDYDSRMLSGTDVFSDGMHAAVIIDRSFLTDKAWFNSNTGEVRLQVPESELPAGYVDNMNQLIATKFDAAAQILRNDYYRFAFENK